MGRRCTWTRAEGGRLERTSARAVVEKKEVFCIEVQSGFSSGAVWVVVVATISKERWANFQDFPLPKDFIEEAPDFSAVDLDAVVFVPMLEENCDSMKN